ncbi:histidine phosphatase family protein [Acidocella sp.]|uniref:histidine phosphatase family protein n=1 Tax=Acidocella sp. TaxID=50710 RepID=UPI0026286A38|nr:histidine phosphatase family protein [Acidocella sp.]MDD2794758.1 histidine phosphatase family protein [Acidocella sp.]
MQLPAVPFWFLRHGETDYNAAGLSQGVLDISLNATGRAQAEVAGPLLAGQGIRAIISSPMIRTRETAAIVNEFLNLPVSIEADLREVIFGGMEGKPLQPWFPEWMEGRYTPEGAETFAEVTIRTRIAMRRVLAQPGPVLIVAHGGIFRALRDLMGLSKEGLTPNAVPLFCDPTENGWEVRMP